MSSRTALTFVGVLQAMRTGLRFGFLACLVLLLGLAVGCSDDDGGGVMPPPPPLVTMFVASGTPAAPNGFRMEGSVNGDEVEIRVMIGGATTSQDLYAFAFDILLTDQSVVQFKERSFGDALFDTNPGPPPQDQVAFVSQVGDRVIVGVSKTQRGSGNGIAAGEKTILSMTFAVNAGTTDLTFVASPAPGVPGANPTNEPTGLDSNLDPVDLDFDVLSATISR